MTIKPACSKKTPVKCAFLRFYGPSPAASRQDERGVLSNAVLSINLLVPNDDYYQLLVKKGNDMENTQTADRTLLVSSPSEYVSTAAFKRECCCTEERGQFQTLISPVGRSDFHSNPNFCLLRCSNCEQGKIKYLQEPD